MLNVTCIRCGVCCRAVPCRLALLEQGACVYLSYRAGIAHCKLVDTGVVGKQDVRMGNPCVFRAVPNLYEHYKTVAAKVKVKVPQETGHGRGWHRRQFGLANCRR